MFKFLIQLFAVFQLIAAFSNEKSQNRILDFEQIDVSTIPGYELLDWNRIGKLCAPFNNALDLGPYFFFLKNKYHLEAAIETGTYTGETTKFFGLIFDEVHTVEIKEDFLKNAKKNLSDFKNIHLHLGNSSSVLQKILPSLKNRPILFYLDAHWYSNWPLLGELEAISKTHKDNCIIVVDDFKVPGKNISYDHWNGKACSLEYIKEKLSKVFSSYDYYYLIPKSISARAKFIAIPKKWGDHSQLIKTN